MTRVRAATNDIQSAVVLCLVGALVAPGVLRLKLQAGHPSLYVLYGLDRLERIVRFVRSLDPLPVEGRVLEYTRHVALG